MLKELDRADFSLFDKSNMIGQIKSFTKDFIVAWRETESIEWPENYRDVKNVVLLGMGGSGAANELMKELSFKTSCPVECVHDYALPGYVDQNSLVVASSYSGNTEETTSGFAVAKKRAAKLFAVTTGGKLEQMAKEFGAPSFIFKYPSQPRMAAPYLFSPLLRIFSRLNFYPLPQEFEQVCQEAEEILCTFFPEIPLSQNRAKELALDLHGRFPIIYSPANIRGLAMRFKNQINENAKTAAACEYFPELNHNTIEGYSYASRDLIIVMLESKFGSERIKLRQRITAEILERGKIKYAPAGFDRCKNELVEHLVLMSFADAVSYYLTFLNRTDPASIPNIEYLKSKL